MSTRSIRLVPFDETYLELSWTWLNDPEIKAMTLTPDFTREDQRAFFEALPTREDYRIWGVEALDGTPIGAGGFKNCDGGTAMFWCYIGERAWWGRGVGGQILDLCEDEARQAGIDRLTMIADEGNARSLGAYRKAGFVDDAVQDRPGFTTLTKPLKP